MKTRILSIITAATVLSGCAGSSTQPASGMQTLLPEHNPKVTFSVDTVRTDTTASNPACLPENTETFFTSAIRTCLPVLRGLFHAVHF